MKIQFSQFSKMLLAFPFLLGACSEPAEEAGIEDLLCETELSALDIGEDYFEIRKNPLVMAGALVHANRFEAGSDLDYGEGCLLAQVDFEDGDRLYIYDFKMAEGEFSSRYQFIMESHLESENFIALNSFNDIDAIAHELDYAPEELRVYHLDEFADGEIRIYNFFAGEPSVNELMAAVSTILSRTTVPLVTVVLGEQFEIILSEEFFDEE